MRCNLRTIYDILAIVRSVQCAFYPRSNNCTYSLQCGERSRGQCKVFIARFVQLLSTARETSLWISFELSGIRFYLISHLNTAVGTFCSAVILFMFFLLFSEHNIGTVCVHVGTYLQVLYNKVLMVPLNFLNRLKHITVGLFHQHLHVTQVNKDYLITRGHNSDHVARKSHGKIIRVCTSPFSLSI